jgi:WD40 repeat protein
MDETIKIWDSTSYILLHTLDKSKGGHSGPIFSLIVMADGHIISGSGDNSIKFWHGKDYSLIKTLDR